MPRLSPIAKKDCRRADADRDARQREEAAQRAERGVELGGHQCWVVVRSFGPGTTASNSWFTWTTCVVATCELRVRISISTVTGLPYGFMIKFKTARGARPAVQNRDATRPGVLEKRANDVSHADDTPSPFIYTPACLE